MSDDCGCEACCLPTIVDERDQLNRELDDRTSERDTIMQANTRHRTERDQAQRDLEAARAELETQLQVVDTARQAARMEAFNMSVIRSQRDTYKAALERILEHDKHGGICGFVGDIAAEALRAGKDGNDNGK